MKLKTSSYILLISLLSFLAGCDSPRTRKVTANAANSSNSSSGYTFDRNDTGSNTGTTTGGSNSSGSSSNSNLPTDAKHCTFSSDGQNNYSYQSSHITSYNICKSSTDNNTFYVQIKEPNSNSQGASSVNICLIPMTQSSGKSIHVGNPQCGAFTDSKTIRKITFVKSSAYSSATINSIMVFKDLKYYYPGFGVTYSISTLQAYSTCMSYLNLYGNSYYCEAFKSANYYTLFSEQSSY